ncbi:hypothetical protein QMK33_00385 [Hymenobacter sp. H14-R3]|uniref:hypothetical protein n=1 Tax=Hymenobacter sp. H14-R3 TaxID=3046308 RepID=UPI0024BBA2FC|nr:hypothetical protein [Hymenobacter sp. H14-R3]MDJ0363591.1 hypothetical protein [Hymenobacter sp. H14-R3]
MGKIRTLQQNQRLHTLLAEAGLTAEKEALAKQFSNNRTGRTSELFTTECGALIDHLEASLGLAPVAPTPEQEEESERMRNKILSLAHEMRWELPGTEKVDMGRVNTWCQTYTKTKKHFNHYTHAELVAMVTQFKVVYRKYLKELEK